MPTSALRALLGLPGFIDRADRQPAPPAGVAGCLIQPGHGEPAYHPIAAKVSQTARLSSRWVLSGVRSPACAAIVHPFRRGIWLITAAA